MDHVIHHSVHFLCYVVFTSQFPCPGCHNDLTDENVCECVWVRMCVSVSGYVCECVCVILRVCVSVRMCGCGCVCVYGIKSTHARNDPNDTLSLNRFRYG